jgi:hypothetical protein
VAHDLDEQALDRAFDEIAGYEVRFPVGAFQLYEKGRDGMWRVHRDFRLTPAQPRPVDDSTAG